MCLEVLAQIADNAPGRIGAKRLGELSRLNAFFAFLGYTPNFGSLRLGSPFG
jgi:hypothetical protein